MLPHCKPAVAKEASRVRQQAAAVQVPVRSGLVSACRASQQSRVNLVRAATRKCANCHLVRRTHLHPVALWESSTYTRVNGSNANDTRQGPAQKTVPIHSHPGNNSGAPPPLPAWPTSDEESVLQCKPRSQREPLNPPADGIRLRFQQFRLICGIVRTLDGN